MSGPGIRVDNMNRQRMSGRDRREQLISVGRAAFAELGFDGASVEEIAHRAGVSKPVLYEHFGGKEGLYAVVIDREMQSLEAVVTEALDHGSWRQRIEQAALALLTYVEQETDGFLILARDSKPGASRSYATLLNGVVGQVTHILATAFAHRGLDESLAMLYGQALVGMVSSTAQWWLDERTPDKEVVAAHIVNLCWNGMSGLQAVPRLTVAAEGASLDDAPGGPTARTS